MSKSWQGALGLWSLLELPGTLGWLKLLLLVLFVLLLLFLVDSLFDCLFLLPKPRGNGRSCGNLRIILPDVMRRPNPSCKTFKKLKIKIYAKSFVFFLLDEQKHSPIAEISLHVWLMGFAARRYFALIVVVPVFVWLGSKNEKINLLKLHIQ